MAENYAETPAGMLDALKGLQTGLATGLPAGLTQLAAGGQVSAVTDLQAEINGYVTIYAAVPTAAEAHVKAVQARDQAAPNIMPRVAAIRAAVKTALGKKSPDLAKFDMAPDKAPPAPTVAQKQDRVAKNLATRAARHTVGPKAKKAIHGAAPPAGGTPPTPAATPAVK